MRGCSSPKRTTPVKMELVILGSGTAHPVGHKGPSGLWLSDGDTSILIDCGSGICEKLTRAGGDLREVDAVLLTHAHIDHISDLSSLLFALRIPSFVRRRPLEIIHSAPLRPYIDGLRDTFGDWLVPDSCEVHYRSVAANGAFTVG